MGDPASVYRYIIRGSSAESFKTTEYNTILKSGYQVSEEQQLPLTTSINIQHFEESFDYTKERLRIFALENCLNRNSYMSQHYKFSSQYGDKSTQELSLISIPSVFFGSCIKKGTVELSISRDGIIYSKIQDTRLNGELIETTGSSTGSVAGVVLYNEGFILLTGSWNNDPVVPWKLFSTGSQEIMDSCSFYVNFNGVNPIQTITMMAHASKGEFNHSNNPTYVKYGEAINYNSTTSSISYSEPDFLEIKNITKYPYENFSGSLEKQTYISKIGLYDDKKNLIGIAKLAKPVRKSESRDFTFKLKLDI